MRVNSVRNGDRILCRAINIALPGALTAQRQDALTHQMRKRGGRVGDNADTFIPRDRR
jgi:hypothetical protein